MAEFRELISEVMDLARDYSPRTSTAMQRRKSALEEMAKIARLWLRDGHPDLMAEFDVRTEGGGQVGGVSPVAWMRVYSKTKSPSATDGFYLVYLFDALGQRTYLSLNQGTSEYRAGQWRPISDLQKLSANTVAARLALEQSAADASWGNTEPLRLAAQALRDRGVLRSRDPVARARNYELGSVSATAYERSSVPTDERLKQDLLTALGNLAILYDTTIEGVEHSTSPGTVPTTGRSIRRLSAPERRAVEIQSMVVTTQYYKERGWAVTDVSARRPYDLECDKEGRTLHVEVKGSTAVNFRQIELTRNEVDHCGNNPTMELALVSGIRLEVHLSDSPVAEGGVITIIAPWHIEACRLKPLTFVYELSLEDLEPESTSTKLETCSNV
jgi:hypothetical protein